ncbi:MAG: hypothetical protein R3A49_04775 [Acidimicrobiia bacterium]
MRSYRDELATLSEAYAVALAADVDDRVLRPAPWPLLAVGSGGSGTVARYIADIHRLASGAVTAPLSPLGVVRSPPPPRGTRVVLVSAAGSNTDILAAWERVATWVGTEVVVLCGEPDSELAHAVRSAGESLILLDRYGEESFVACASQLVPSVITAKAVGADLPRRYEDLIGPVRGDIASLGELWGREVLVALHGAEGSAAASGLESNFTEAALGTVSRCDFRDLAHGRYLWLERQGARTGMVTLESEIDRSLADRTVDLVPDRIPRGRVRLTGQGPVAGLQALAAVLEMTADAGEERGIDPAQPGKDLFGPALYDLELPGP